MNTIAKSVKKIYINKFSFGISLGISIDDYNKIIDKYKEYISSVYFSLPLGTEFHTRNSVVEEYSMTNAQERLFDILDLFKKNGIKLEVVINQYNIPKEKILSAIKYLKQELVVDSICTLDEYVETIRDNFPNQYLVSSFNNDSKIIKKDLYNEIVIGRKFLRDINYMRYINNLGLDVKLLLNNGCSFNCGTCRAGGKNCEKVFKQNLSKFNIEEIYALQSFWPYELERLKHKIDFKYIKEFKISNRPCTYKYLDDCLSSYIYNDEKKEEIFLKEDINNYRLWGRLSHFNKYLDKLRIDEIKKIKDELWK